MRSVLTRCQLGLVALSLLVAASCQQDVSVEVPLCVTALDCPTDQSCEYNFCIRQGSNTLDVHSKIIPPPTTGHVQQQIPKLDLSAGPALEIALLKPVVFQGVIQRASASFSGTNVPGYLEARTAGDLQGHPYKFTTRSLNGLNENGYGYVLAVLPGRDYQVVFRADDSTLPPHIFSIPAEKVQTGILNIELPDEQYVRIGGFVRFDPMTPIGKAKVSAILPSGIVTAATLTESGAGPKGHFMLDVPPSTESVQIRVQRTDDTPLFADYVTEPMKVGEDLAIWVPPRTGKEIVATVRLVKEKDGEAGPVPETTVTLEYLAGKLRLSATTDADGVAQFVVLEGDYQLAVSPQASSWVASLSRQVSFNEGTASVEITLPNRILCKGEVLSTLGEPVIHGVVTLEKIVDEEDSEQSILASMPTTTSLDAMGQFEAWVDPGAYRVRVTPAPETGQPAYLMETVIEGEDALLNIELPSPGLAHITIRDTTGQPVPNVAIEVYPSGEAHKTPMYLVKGTSDNAGQIPLLVPHVTAP